MRVLCCLVDVSICWSFCESTTRILYPTSIKIPRPNISYFDDNWSIYRRLAVIHKVHGDCHFSAQRLSPGQHPEQKETMNRLWCRNENDKKNPAPRSRNFPIIEPKILYFVTPVALLSSLTEDGSTDLAPISSFWALGWNCRPNVPAHNYYQQGSDAHRHDDVAVAIRLVGKRAHLPGALFVFQFNADGTFRRSGQKIQNITGIESNRNRITLVILLDDLFCFAVFRTRCGNLDAFFRHRHFDGMRTLIGKLRNAAHGIAQFRALEHYGLVVIARQHCFVVRELPGQDARNQQAVIHLER